MHLIKDSDFLCVHSQSKFSNMIVVGGCRWMREGLTLDERWPMHLSKEIGRQMSLCMRTERFPCIRIVKWCWLLVLGSFLPHLNVWCFWNAVCAVMLSNGKSIFFISFREALGQTIWICMLWSAQPWPLSSLHNYFPSWETVCVCNSILAILIWRAAAAATDAPTKRAICIL